jgi:hypothetical protein
MTSLKYILSVAVIVATSASQLSRAATDPYPEAHPPAGKAVLTLQGISCNLAPDAII